MFKKLLLPALLVLFTSLTADDNNTVTPVLDTNNSAVIDTNNSTVIDSIAPNKIIKDKANLVVMTSKGKMKNFTIDYIDGALKFDKKVLKHILNESKSSVVKMNIHTKLIIPNELNDDAVSIQANNLSSVEYTYGTSFYSFINGTYIKNGESNLINVINDGNLRYVKLNTKVTCVLGKLETCKKLINNIEKLNYTLEDHNNHKLSSFIMEDRADKINLITYTNNGKMKSFDINYDGNGFVFDKKSYKFISDQSKKNIVKMNIHAKLLIPNEIQGNTVNVQANNRSSVSHTYGTSFYTYINGTGIEGGESNLINIIHDGSLRYVRLNIKMTCLKGRFGTCQQIINTVGNLNYLVTDADESEKFFAFKTLNTKINSNIPLEINVVKGKNTLTSKSFNINYNRNGFMLNKKPYKFISDQLKKNIVKMNIHAKLIIPDEIKGDSVNVQANNLSSVEYTYGTSLYSYINKTQIQAGESNLIKVINDAGLRYVNLTINTTCLQGKFDTCQKIIYDLGKLNYIVTDNEDGEKFFAFKEVK